MNNMKDENMFSKFSTKWMKRYASTSKTKGILLSFSRQ